MAALLTCCAGPEWQSALAAWVLVVVTVVAVVVGAIAALSAARTYALEAEPVVIVRQQTLAEAFSSTEDEKRGVIAAQHYVVAPNPTLKVGIALRPYEAQKDDPNYAVTGRVDQTPKRPRIVMVLKNVGRSPAVDVEIEWKVSTPIFIGDDIDVDNLEIGEQAGRGVTKIAALAPLESTYILIENRLGNIVSLTVEALGLQTEWRKASRPKKRIAVIADRPSFTIESP